MFVDTGGDVVSVSVGASHTCALLEGGSLKCWGSNSSGQLGVDPSLNSPNLPTPTSVELSHNVSQLAVGYDHTCVLFENGRIKCWGRNGFGQLGYGHTANFGRSILTLPERLPFVDVGGRSVKIAASGFHTCAVLENGSLKCWGYNSNGQLGYGHTDNLGDDERLDSFSFVSVGSGVIDVVLGNNSTCAILEGQNVKCWGIGSLTGGHDSNIGDDELPSSIESISLGNKINSLAVSGSHACAILDNQKMRCWGNNPVNSIAPRLVREDSRFLDIAVGSSYTCALETSGNVLCWGVGGAALGLGHSAAINDDYFFSDEDSTVFSNFGNVIVASFNYSIDEIDFLEVNFDASSSFSQNTIKSYAWNFGDEMIGAGEEVSHTFSKTGEYTITLTVEDNFEQSHQISKRVLLTSEIENATPVLVSGTVPDGTIVLVEQDISVQKGKTITFTLNGALDFDSSSLTYNVVNAPVHGTLLGCLNGDNDLSCEYVAPSDFEGEVTFSYKANDGTSDSNTAQIKMQVLEESPLIKKIYSNYNQSCALFENKKIKCWGKNNYSQLGYIGTNSNIGDNELASAQPFVDIEEDIASLSLGREHTCALLGDKNVRCWGYGGYSRTVLGHNYSSLGSELSLSLDIDYNIAQVASGSSHNCVLFENGRIKCWGDNGSGQLGYGHKLSLRGHSLSTHERIPFVDVSGRALKVSTGGSHSCAIIEGGNLNVGEVTLVGI